MSKSQVTLGNDAPLERSLELRHLRQRISQRKSLLLFGEQGVGKTRLLQQIAASNKDVLYIAKGHAPREFLHALIGALDPIDAARARRSRSLQSMSVLSLKGVAQKGLETGNSILMIDHVQSPTMALGHLIKGVEWLWENPSHLCRPIAAYGRYWLKHNRDHLKSVRTVFLRGEEAKYEAAIEREELEAALEIEHAEGFLKKDDDD